MTDARDEILVTLTADIVAAHLANNMVPVAEIGGLVTKVHDALAGLGEGSAPKPEAERKPAVAVRASIKPEHIICLEDGKKMKMLKRHLMTDHGLTPADYRARWNLPTDYPMVALNYAEARRGLAMKIGLGRKKKEAPAPAPKAKRGRPPKHA